VGSNQTVTPGPTQTATTTGTSIPEETLVANFNRFIAARTAYQGQINEVYVYGSDKAWSGHQAVAKTLPPSLGGSELPNIGGRQPDQVAFPKAFSEFLDVRCTEVTALPRNNCPQD
jgi:hypothetical protein